MKSQLSILWMFASIGLVAACATAPSSTQVAAEATECTENVFTTGSMISKRQKCALSAAEGDRDRAQDAARDMRDEQLRRAPPRSVTGGM